MTPVCSVSPQDGLPRTTMVTARGCSALLATTLPSGATTVSSS